MSENELNNKKEHKEQNSTKKLIRTGTEFGPNWLVILIISSTLNYLTLLKPSFPSAMGMYP